MHEEHGEGYESYEDGPSGRRKTTVFLTDMDDLADVNGVYASLFTDLLPARSAVADATLPTGAEVGSTPSHSAANLYQPEVWLL